jgi:hypothetical protein
MLSEIHRSNQHSAPVDNFSWVDEVRPDGAASEGDCGVVRGSAEDGEEGAAVPSFVSGGRVAQFNGAE